MYLHLMQPSAGAVVVGPCPNSKPSFAAPSPAAPHTTTQPPTFLSLLFLNSRPASLSAMTWSAEGVEVGAGVGYMQVGGRG